MKRKELQHDISPAALQKDLQAIEEELKRPVDRKTFLKLFQKLETAQKDCSLLKTKYSISAEKFLFGIEEKIISLFGEVMTTHVDTEVNAILEMSSHLSAKDHKRAQFLHAKILALKKWHRPSKENLQKLAQAEKNIGMIHSSNSIKEHQVDVEEAEHLLQIASFVYYKNKQERQKSYLSLSEEAKKRFQKHLICLKTTAFDKEESTIQALFVTAFEMAGIPTAYPSSSEITEFFEEEKKQSDPLAENSQSRPVLKIEKKIS